MENLQENREVKEVVKNEGVTKQSVVKELISTIIYIGAVILLTWVFITFVAQRTQVSGRSMMNTLQDGDSLIVSKISYELGRPDRFDVVVFPHMDEFTGEESYFIKRVIALPGETIQIKPNANNQFAIFINGQELQESYGREVIMNPGRAALPITLGPDEYFVMGDNRNDSLDSRYETVGNVPRKIIIGKAFIRVFPFSSFGLVD